MGIGQIVQAITAAGLDVRVKTDAINALKPFEGQINTLLEYEPKMAPGQDLACMVADYVMGIVGPVFESGGVSRTTQGSLSMSIYSALRKKSYSGV